MSLIIMLLVLYYVGKALKPKRKPSRQRKTQDVVTYQPKPLTKAETAKLRKEWQYQQRAEYEVLVARNDLDRLELEKTTLIRLLEAIEAELKTADKPQRITTLLTKQSVTEKQIHALDRKLEKAYYVANATIY